MAVAENILPKKINGLLSKTLDAETVILKIKDRNCYLLNRTASYIWRLANGKNSVKNIIDSFSKKYGIKKPIASKHAKKLLVDLEKKGLIDFKQGTVLLAATL